MPGLRIFSLLEPVEFPWRDAVDYNEDVGSFVSYERSLELCRNGLLVGPSSGLALEGLFQFLRRKKEAGELDQLRNEEGEVSCKSLSLAISKFSDGAFDRRFYML